jgi:hypothetical protein
MIFNQLKRGSLGLAYSCLAIMAFGPGQLRASTITSDASDPTVFGPFTFVNNTGKAAADLETVWTFTGGSLAGGIVSVNGGPGAATITATSNMVNITWNDGGLGNTKSVSFTMTSDFGANFNSGVWTFNAGAAPIPATPTPEPATMLLVAGALAGVVSFRKIRGRAARA